MKYLIVILMSLTMLACVKPGEIDHSPCSESPLIGTWSLGADNITFDANCAFSLEGSRGVFREVVSSAATRGAVSLYFESGTSQLLYYRFENGLLILE